MTTEVDRLGADRLTAREVPFYKHQLGQAEIDAVASVLGTFFLTTGPKTKELEGKLAEYWGVGQAVGVTSATMGLFLSLRALGIGPGDEVITTPMTFIATANVVMHLGAKPVFVDVEPDTGNIDASLIPAAITNKTKAILPVHLYGQMVDMKAIAKIAEEKKLHVVEDCAHAFESERDGVKPGQLSDAACFSFYATKNVACGEGGAIGTRSQALDEKLRLLRLHGMSALAYDRYAGNYKHWDMVDLGYKANLPDVLSAMVLPQLPLVEEKSRRRHAIALKYDELLSKIPGVSVSKTRPGVKHAHHLYTAWVPPERRDEVLHRLQQAKVGVAVNYRAIHLLTYFKEKFGYERGAFPIAEKIGDSTLSLPMYPTLTDEDIEYVASTLHTIMTTPA